MSKQIVITGGVFFVSKVFLNLIEARELKRFVLLTHVKALDLKITPLFLVCLCQLHTGLLKFNCLLLLFLYPKKVQFLKLPERPITSPSMHVYTPYQSDDQKPSINQYKSGFLWSNPFCNIWREKANCRVAFKMCVRKKSVTTFAELRLCLNST